MFRNVNLSNLENVLHGNLRTDRTSECIFRASGGTNFENFSFQRQPWLRFLEFGLYTGLPKKLWIRHWIRGYVTGHAHVRLLIRGEKVCFLENFACFVFLLPLF